MAAPWPLASVVLRHCCPPPAGATPVGSPGGGDRPRRLPPAWPPAGCCAGWAVGCCGAAGAAEAPSDSVDSPPLPAAALPGVPPSLPLLLEDGPGQRPNGKTHSLPVTQEAGGGQPSPPGSSGAKDAATGNRTPASCVTGRDTNHYTIATESWRARDSIRTPEEPGAVTLVEAGDERRNIS